MLMHTLIAAVLIAAQPPSPPLTAEEARVLRIAMKALEADSPKADFSRVFPAMEKLATLGPKAAPAVPLLMQMFERANVGEGFEGDFRRAITAAEVLGAIGPDAQAAVPLLLKCFETETTIHSYDREEYQKHLRGQVAPQLARIAPSTELAEKFNRKLLNHIGADDEIEATLKALAIIGPVGKPALPGIAACLERYREDKCRVREDHAFKALRTMGPEGVTVLIEQCKASKGKEGPYLKAFGEMGSEAAPAVPLLIDSLLDQSESSRSLAATSLGQLGVNTPEVIEALNDATKDTSKHVREAANTALKSLQRAVPVKTVTGFRPA